MGERIDRLEATISLFSKTATIQEIGMNVSTSVRIPAVAHATCKALSQHSAQSMNRVLVELLEVGLELVLEGMPDGDRDEVLKLRAPILHELIKSGDFESGEIK